MIDSSISSKINNQQKGSPRKEPSKYRQAWRPKLEKVNNNSEECPYCHASISSDLAICPHCGHSLTPEKCSFCGAPMKPKAKFCSRCGQSREGVVCPECGTLNARNFCRHCNAPLTPMGRQALEQAKNDPKFKAIQKKADALAELQLQIDQLQKESAEAGHQPAELSEEDKAILNEYAEILASIGSSKIEHPQLKPIEPQKRREYSDPAANLQDIMEAYKEKAAELNATLAALVPPPEYTPEQQRDYYSARKVMTVNQEFDMSGYVPYLWKCNLCGALHQSPPECAKPELGGTWVHISVGEFQKEHQAISVTMTID